MQSKRTIGIIGWMLLTLLTPTSLKAQQETFGTSRQPQTCPSRSEPSTGRLTVAQALKYTRCWFEDKNKSRGVYFAEISNFKLSPPHQVTERDSLQQWTINNIDRTQPMYDIKAHVVYYMCAPIHNHPSYPNTYPATGKNCQIFGSVESNPLNSSGICFKDLTEQWHCRLTVKGKPVYGPPPAK
jgi:hypothetical protein